MAESSPRRAHLAAQVEVRRPRAEVFAFLSDLDNHWRIAGPAVRPVSADADGLGATVRFGPPGIRRRTRTRIERLESPTLIEGSARTNRSRGFVRWRLDAPGPGTTLVRFDQELNPAGVVDTLLVALSVRWLRRQYVLVLERLKAELE